MPWLQDRKWCYIRMEGTTFGDVPLNAELKLEVWDSPNSAGVITDAIRCLKLGLDRGLKGTLVAPSSYFMKSPPQQIHDDIAFNRVEAFIKGDDNETLVGTEAPEKRTLRKLGRPQRPRSRRPRRRDRRRPTDRRPSTTSAPRDAGLAGPQIAARGAASARRRSAPRVIERLAVVGYRATSWLLARVPPKSAAAVIGRLSQLSYLAWPTKRRWSNRNFGHVLGLPPDDRRVRAAGAAAHTRLRALPRRADAPAVAAAREDARRLVPALDVDEVKRLCGRRSTAAA